MTRQDSTRPLAIPFPAIQALSENAAKSAKKIGPKADFFATGVAVQNNRISG